MPSVALSFLNLSVFVFISVLIAGSPYPVTLIHLSTYYGSDGAFGAKRGTTVLACTKKLSALADRVVTYRVVFHCAVCGSLFEVEVKDMYLV